MNKLQDLAKLLKVEVNEIFHIECSNGIVYENEYFLGETGNIMMKDATHPEGLPTVWLPELITGKSKIIHIRKQHNVGDRYYVVAYDDEFAKFDRSKGIPNESIKHRQWKGTPIDILMDTLGVVRKSHDDCRKHFWEDYDKLR